jgi:hypothetical protein
MSTESKKSRFLTEIDSASNVPLDICLKYSVSRMSVSQKNFHYKLNMISANSSESLLSLF